MIRAFPIRLLRTAAAALAALSLASVPAGAALFQEHTLNFRNADIQAFIDDVSIVTGYTFIVDPEVRGNVTITSQTPLTEEEVFQVFLATLRTQGFAAVRIRPETYRIVPEAEGARAPRPAREAQGEQFVTTVVRLENASARDVVRSVQPLCPRRAPSTPTTAGTWSSSWTTPRTRTGSRTCCASSTPTPACSS